MKFIPHNASVVAVMEQIPFTVATRINFHPDSTQVWADLTHLTPSPQPQHTPSSI